jgi:hypothetical protein
MECFLPQEYNFAGPDPKLDMVVALLAMGKNDYIGIVSWGFPWSASFPSRTLLTGQIPILDFDWDFVGSVLEQEGLKR